MTTRQTLALMAKVFVAALLLVIVLCSAAIIFLRRPANVDDLFFAIRNDETAFAKKLIAIGLGTEKHVDVGEQWSYPIHAAALDANIEILRQLVELGVSPNEVDCQGKTPLMKVCDGYDEPKHYAGVECLKYLLSVNADVNAKSTGYYDKTALHLAASYGNDHYIEILLDNGADINAQIRSDRNGESSGNTPLHEACLRPGHLDTKRLLVSKGADLTIRNGRGLTPRELVIENYKLYLSLEPRWQKVSTEKKWIELQKFLSAEETKRNEAQQLNQ